MGWIYLAELEGLESHFKDGCEQSPIVNRTDTHKPFYCPECNRVTLIERQYGTMCEHLERRYLEANESTLFLEAFRDHARILVLQEMEKAWRESEADFFTKSQDLQVNLDRASFSWRTCQQSLFGGLTEFVWNSLRWGMIVDGQLFQPKKLEPTTPEKDGSCLPTPVASRCGYQSQGNGTKRYMLPQLWKMGRLPTPTARDYKDRGLGVEMKRKSPSLPTFWKATHGTNMPPSFVEWIMGFNIGHTALSAAATAWFHHKPKKHLKD